MHMAAQNNHSTVVTALVAAGAMPDTATEVCSVISNERCADSSVV